MKQENKVMNTSLVPPEDASSKAKKTRFTMNIVDPRYQNYSRPLMIIILVAVLKFVLMITTFNIVMSVEPKKTWIHAVPKIEEVQTTSKSCTRADSYQQFYGNVHEIRDFIWDTKTPEPETSNENIEVNVNVTVDITVDMCLRRPVKVMTYFPSYSTPLENNQNGMNALENCFVPDEFRRGLSLIHNNAELCGDTVRWCWDHNQDNINEAAVFEFCDGLEEEYSVWSNAQLRTLSGVPDIKADPAFNTLSTTCPPIAEP